MDINVEDIAQGKISPEQAAELHKYFQGGGTWQELLKMEPEKVERLYAEGNKFYNQEKYEQALGAFSALIQINPYAPHHWIALGATLQAQKEYTDALASYEIALTIKGDHIPTLYYSAQCAFALEKESECVEFLNKVVTLSAEKQEECELAEKAQKILTLIEKGGR